MLFDVAVAATENTPDWWARAIGGLGFLMAAATAVVGWRSHVRDAPRLVVAADRLSLIGEGLPVPVITVTVSNRGNVGGEVTSIFFQEPRQLLRPATWLKPHGLVVLSLIEGTGGPSLPAKIPAQSGLDWIVECSRLAHAVGQSLLDRLKRGEVVKLRPRASSPTYRWARCAGRVPLRAEDLS